VHSFEPVPSQAAWLRQLAGRSYPGRWQVHEVALGAGLYERVLNVCTNQPTASSLLRHGDVRSRLGIVDEYEQVPVQVRTLSAATWGWQGPALVKIDVEGWELEVLYGCAGSTVLETCTGCIVECQNVPGIFQGAPSPLEVTRELHRHGLTFAGVLDCYREGDFYGEPESGRVLQFDGLWLP
jgi:FkbM family methyltransferase